MRARISCLIHPEGPPLAGGGIIASDGARRDLLPGLFALVLALALSLLAALACLGCQGTQQRSPGDSLAAELAGRTISVREVRNLSGVPLARLNAGPYVADNGDLATLIGDDDVVSLLDVARSVAEALLQPRQPASDASASTLQLHIAISRWDQTRLNREGVVVFGLHAALALPDGRLLREVRVEAEFQILERSFEGGAYVPRYSTRFDVNLGQRYQQMAEILIALAMDRLGVLLPESGA